MEVFKILLVVCIILSNYSINTQNPTQNQNTEPYVIHHTDMQRNYKSYIELPFNEQWEKLMTDFESDFVYMIPLNHQEPQFFYEDIKIVPARIRGAIILNSDVDKKEFNFKLSDDMGYTIAKIANKEFIFDFTAYRPGKLTFFFNNVKVFLKFW